MPLAVSGCRRLVGEQQPRFADQGPAIATAVARRPESAAGPVLEPVAEPTAVRAAAARSRCSARRTRGRPAAARRCPGRRCGRAAERLEHEADRAVAQLGQLGVGSVATSPPRCSSPAVGRSGSRAVHQRRLTGPGGPDDRDDSPGSIRRLTRAGPRPRSRPAGSCAVRRPPRRPADVGRHLLSVAHPVGAADDNPLTDLQPSTPAPATVLRAKPHRTFVCDAVHDPASAARRGRRWRRVRRRRLRRCAPGGRRRHSSRAAESAPTYL